MDERFGGLAAPRSVELAAGSDRRDEADPWWL